MMGYYLDRFLFQLLNIIRVLYTFDYRVGLLQYGVFWKYLGKCLGNNFQKASHSSKAVLKWDVASQH